jgi:hypothetical protein
MQTRGSRANKLKRQSFFAVAFFFFIPAVIFSSVSEARAEDKTDSGDYLYEYALKIYGERDICDDVLHELNKALKLNPYSIKAKYVLRKLSPKGALTASTKTNNLITSNDKICLGEEIIFDAPPTSNYGWQKLFYIWDFGDGITQKCGSSVSHSYVKAGKYTVSVSIDNQPDSYYPLEIREFQVQVNSAPIAKIGQKLVGQPNADSVFDASDSSDPDGDSLTYKWDFGDGATAEGEKTTHCYTRPGRYTVTLTVKDNSYAPCDTAKASFEATVSDKPISVIKVR